MRYDRNVLVMTPERRAMLTQAQAECIQAIEAQEAFWSFYYYSKINFEFVRENAAPGPYLYRLVAGTEVVAFSYGLRQPMLGAGFLAADGNATRSETNLLRGQETRSGEAVHIKGLSVLPMKGGTGDPTVPPGRQMTGRFSDARAIAQVLSNASVRLVMNGGNQQFTVGITEFLPAAGGFLGEGIDELGTQAIAGGRLPFSFPANGWPIAQNYFPMPEGILWTPKGDSDSSLELNWTIERDLVLDSGGSPENAAADEVAAAGIRGYNYPEVLFAQFMVFLIGDTVTSRTRVQ